MRPFEPSQETTSWRLRDKKSATSRFCGLTSSKASRRLRTRRSKRWSIVHQTAPRSVRWLDVSTQKSRSKDDTRAIGRDMTLVSWCDSALHKQVEWTLNREVIKWCEAFLDEGHAVWPMPGREQGFYAAWRSLAAREWSPCGIADSGRKIAALPESPEEAVWSHLDALGIGSELRGDYLSLELASLYGWASFIRWRAEQKFELLSYEWQTLYPIDLVQYLAVRLFYGRELVEQTCRAELGIEGKLDAIVSHVRDRRKGADSGGLETARLASAWRLSMLATALGLSPAALEQAAPAQLDLLVHWLNDFPESEHGPCGLRPWRQDTRKT